MSIREAVIVSTARTPIGRAYRGAFNATPSPTLASHAIKAAVERARVDPGRDRRRDHGRGAPAGRPGDDRPHRGAARRPAGHRRRHVDRPPVRLGPDGDRHRGQADHRRPDGRVRRRRRRIDQPGADAGDAARLRSRAAGDAQERLHADDRHRRGGRQALRHRRERQDEYALQSQQRTAAAQAAGRFDDEIVPVTANMAVKDKETGRDLDEGGHARQGRGQPPRHHARRACAACSR